MSTRRCTVSLLVATLAAIVAPGIVHAGAFIFSGSSNPNVIAHPTGYTGTGNALSVSVCIDPASANAASMVVPVQNIVDTWNARLVASPNLLFGASNNIGASQYDFESVALHELGHCIGLAHPNLSSESGLSGNDQNYTKATSGADVTYDLGIGADGIRGSGDDARNDDENLHWFRRSDNNPFNASSTADTTTYARAVASLPAGHTFAANADRTVGAALGFANTESVMQQGTFNDEDQRRLAADDAATLLLGMSGLDMTAGSGDDYTLTLTYGGLSSACNVVLGFDDTRTSFATCYTSGSYINSNHIRITAANVYFASGIAWFFNPTSSSPTTTSTSTSSSTTSSSVPSTTSSTSSTSSSTSSSSTSSTSSTSPSSTTTSTSSSSTTSSSLPSSTTSSTLTTSTTTTTLPLDTCDAVARGDCIEATEGSLLIDETLPSRGRLRVVMKSLAATLASPALGDPVAGSTSYAVCFYDDTRARIGGLTLARAGAGCGVLARPCWRGLGPLGFRYADRDASVHGIRRVLLKNGPVGAGKVLLKAKLNPGHSRSGLPPGMPLALVASGSATAQFVASDGVCISVTTDEVVGADAARFSARRR
jgi:hypothetical protein